MLTRETFNSCDRQAVLEHAHIRAYVTIALRYRFTDTVKHHTRALPNRCVCLQYTAVKLHQDYILLHALIRYSNTPTTNLVIYQVAYHQSRSQVLLLLAAS